MMNRKIAAMLLTLPIGALTVLSQSANAAERTSLAAERQSPIVIAQRYDDQRDRNQNDNRREAIRREEARREQRVWVPGHWEHGFLGIGRKWVGGHWEKR